MTTTPPALAAQDRALLPLPPHYLYPSLTRRYRHGWYKVAFERDLTPPLTAASIGPQRLVLARTERGLRAFEANCPHRGAHLALGGTLEGECIVCPFHGYRVRLGEGPEGGFNTREFPTLVVGGMVFVRLSDSHENGLSERLATLAESHAFIPGFEMPLRAPMEAVIENGFDRRHFLSVHGVQAAPLELSFSPHGALLIQSLFGTPPTQRNARVGASGLVEVPMQATTISPGLAIVQLGGETPYAIITGATNQPGGGSIIRLSLVLPRAHFGDPPPPAAYNYLLRYSRRGLEDDQLMWENMEFDAPMRLTEEDRPLVHFYQFCLGFTESPA